MNRVLFAAFIALMIGCDQNATVLVSDGGSVAAICHGDRWARCVADKCPNGFDVVENACNGCDAIIKCMP